MGMGAQIISTENRVSLVETPSLANVEIGAPTGASEQALRYLGVGQNHSKRRMIDLSRHERETLLLDRAPSSAAKSFTVSWRSMMSLAGRPGTAVDPM